MGLIGRTGRIERLGWLRGRGFRPLGGETRADRGLCPAAGLRDRTVRRTAERARAALDAAHHVRRLGGRDVVRLDGLRTPFNLSVASRSGAGHAHTSRRAFLSEARDRAAQPLIQRDLRLPAKRADQRRVTELTRRSIRF